MDSSQINDLRTALDFLAEKPGELVSTAVEVDPYLEIAGIYRRVGSGTPTAPPTKVGPAMMFNRIKGCPGWRVLAGLLASRERTALLLGSTKERLMFDLYGAFGDTVPPVTVPAAKAPAQQVVVKPPFDVRTYIPAVQCTPKDAGPFFNLGLLRAKDPETGVSDVTIHRMCVQTADRISVSISVGRHIGAFLEKAWAMGKPLPASCSIGLDPAIYVATSFEAPTTPLGFDELSIAGGLRGRPVELVDCVTQDAKAVARAELVLEGEFRPNDRVDEDAVTGLGWAMPEFPGYVGQAQKNLAVFTVTGITHRVDPILQILVGPGEEHVTLTGLPTETSIYRLIEDAIPGFCTNVYCASAGGGKYLAILQVKKRTAHDEGMQRQAALVAFTAFFELKHVIVVDDDVDVFDANDVMWAMTTRYQGDVDTLFVPAVRGHALDLSATPEYNPLLRGQGITCKTIFDCTVPWELRERFERSAFMDVDLSSYDIR